MQRLGVLFNTDPGLLLKIPKDLTKLTELAKAHKGTVRQHGEVEPLFDAELTAEVIRLVGVNDLYGSISAIVRKKPTPHGGKYDSSYMHSDVWSGNPQGFIVMFPIECEDWSVGGVDFFEPLDKLDQLDKEYSSYEVAPKFNTRYLGYMEPGYMHVVDAFCLHCTKVSEVPRISVDMRFSYDPPVTTRKMNYRPIWDDIEGRN